MVRAVVTFALAGFLALANSGLSSGLCEDACPDDDEQGQCAPDCTDCVCCSHAPQPVQLADGVESTVIPGGAVQVEWMDRALPWVEPREILHVPIVGSA